MRGRRQQTRRRHRGRVRDPYPSVVAAGRNQHTVDDAATTIDSAYGRASMPAHVARGRIAQITPAPSATVRDENCCRAPPPEPPRPDCQTAWHARPEFRGAKIVNQGCMTRSTDPWTSIDVADHLPQLPQTTDCRTPIVAASSYQNDGRPAPTRLSAAAKIPTITGSSTTTLGLIRTACPNTPLRRQIQGGCRPGRGRTLLVVGARCLHGTRCDEFGSPGGSYS